MLMLLRSRQDKLKTHQQSPGDNHPSNFPPVPQPTATAQNQPPPQSPRPGLTRIDSRGNFPYRPPPFPNLPPGGNPQVRPQNLRQPLPPQGGNPQQFGVPPRSPLPGQKPVAQSVTLGGYPQNQQVRPQNIRPQTPYPPRQPLQGPQRPQIFQQRSVPNYTVARPQFLEDSLQRSQTLDSAEVDHQKHADENKMDNGSRPPSVARNDTVTNINVTQQKTDEKAKSDQRTESPEILENKKDTTDYPSRPESRAASRMNRIMEDDVPDVSPMISYDTPHVVNNDLVKPSQPNDGFELKKEVEKSPVKAEKEKQFLDLDKGSKKSLNKSPSRSEGDNDSGVDESTQGNDQSSNCDAKSPRKSSKSRTSCTTPTQARSTSRTSKTSSIQSPDSSATTPSGTEKKKLPMNKIQVGSAPAPNLRVVRSKIGSLENTSYKPGGGKVKIENKKIDFKSVTPRIEAKNDKYIPKGGEKKITQQKLQWNAKSKIGSLENSTYKPKGGDKKIESVKLDFKEKAKSKVGSKDNIKHQPGGGDIKIETKKIEVHATSKVGSLDNVKHKPTGGDKKIFDDKDYLRQKSGKSSMDHSLSGSQNSIPSQPDGKLQLADENLNQEH